MDISNDDTNEGSPPRVRGKVSRSATIFRALGITPACAGKSLFLCQVLSSFQDHPRVCGEKPGGSVSAVMAMGSPPRVRGKAQRFLNNRGKVGITPACAGKRAAGRRGVFAAADHPRVCGEKSCSRSLAPCAGGSPPRVRGKGELLAIMKELLRITPACAGKRLSSVGWQRWQQDHPRVCGEKRLPLRTSSCAAGSPPRVRGKVHVVQIIHAAAGITPACAGKSSRSDDALSMSSDHPRVCGEKVLGVARKKRRMGSPPRVRGKAMVRSRLRRRAGITPACAGKRRPATWTASLPADHPRVCGEKAFVEPENEQKQGSPPRVRGKVNIT